MWSSRAKLSYINYFGIFERFNLSSALNEKNPLPNILSKEEKELQEEEKLKKKNDQFNED